MITPEMLARSGSESGNQQALMCWASTSGIPELKWLFAVPNGFYGSAAQKGKMKAEGLKSGVWDIFLPVPIIESGYEHNYISYCGLFIEMKTADKKTIKNGGLTIEQINFRNDLSVEKWSCNQYKFAVCYSWIEARNEILRYLGKV